MRRPLIAAPCLLLVAGLLAHSADWLQDGGDSMRTNWQKDEKLISTSTAKNIKLLWKQKLDNQVRAMHSLLPPLVIERVNTPNGPKQLVIQAGVSDNVFALDVETGTMAWSLHFESTFQDSGGRGPSVLCPGGMTANVVIGPGDGGGKYIVYAASWDGRLHKVDAGTGKELIAPMKFMPSNGKPYALNLWNNSIYTHSAQGCGGNPNNVYIYDLATNIVGSWGPAGGGMGTGQGVCSGVRGTGR